MGSLTLQLPDELERRMAEHDVNWRVVLRTHIRDELARRDRRNTEQAVTISDRLSRAVGDDAADETELTDRIREWRDCRRRGSGTE